MTESVTTAGVVGLGAMGLQMARHMVVHGLGAGFFTRTYLTDDLGAGRLVPLVVRDLAPIHRDSALVRRARATPLAPAAQRLVDAITAHARRLDLLATPPSRMKMPRRRNHVR